LWQGIFSIPSLLTNALYTFCITQINNSENSRFSLFSYTRERKEYLPFKWYGGAVLAIPKNSLLLCPSSAFRLEEQLPIKQTNQLGIFIDLFKSWGKWVCATAISDAEDLFNKRDVTVSRRIKKRTFFVV